MDEVRVVSIVSATNGAFAIALISLFAWLVELPLLFPALGPTAYILFSRPFSDDAAPRSVVSGHLIAIVVGTGIWLLVGFACGHQVSLEAAQWPAVVSASLTLCVTCLVLHRLSCPHAPACGTALIISLGYASEWRSLLAMAVAVVALTIQAIIINRLAGVNAPLWRPRGSALHDLEV